MAEEPQINDRYPINQMLSPPIVASPIPDCAEAVYVTGFVPHARVRVFANFTDLLAEEAPPFGFAEMRLNRPVKLGESITATQTVENFESPHSGQPVTVSAVPESAVQNTKPDVGDDLYECGIVVPVSNLVPGVRVQVTENNVRIGKAPAAQSWHPVRTRALHATRHVSARQIACEGTDHEVGSPPADSVDVKAAPNPVPSPIPPDKESLIPGDDSVILTGLLVGAIVEVFDQGASVFSGGAASDAECLFPLSHRIGLSSSITATQELCGNVSPPSDPVTPSGKLQAPIVVGPICAGSRFVVLRGTTVNATVVVLRNGTIAAYGGAALDDVILELGANSVFHAGDVVTAIQYMGPTISPSSNAVTVVQSLREPAIEIVGGEPFFLAKGNEQPIDGPVFPRGRGAGPVIHVQACCQNNVRLEVVDPNGAVVAEPALTELFPGYFTATWPWTSVSGWAVPGGVPVGTYTAVVQTDCEQDEARAPFYVIFNPLDVGGPPRFSFDGTAVWFGAGNESIVGLHYYLHQSDQRVFSIAIKAANGLTDPYEAAIAVARAEEQLFAYSLDYHSNDVVDLLVNYNEAQCADDACCLTALLRSVGVPAHPVTADAGFETGAANWNFDTWVEFLAPHGGAPEWRIFHPHQYPGEPPESRGTFGTTRGVATKEFNDVIVMANENWVAANLDDGSDDVTYGRNPCQEPNQQLTKAAWIGELCEAGYWPVPHWDCAGVRPRSLTPGNGFRFYEQDLTFGGHLAGTLDVVNPAEERRFGRLLIELVAHRPESKRFGEATFGQVVTPVTLDPGESFNLPFSLPLPDTVAPGRGLFLWARLDERTVTLQEVRIPPRVACEVEWPDRYGEGEQARIRAIVRNATGEPVRTVDVELVTPYVLQVEQPTYRRFDGLGPYEEREAWWTVRAVAPLQSGSMRIMVASANGGSVVVRRPFSVTGRAPAVEARPASLLSQSQHGR